MLRKTLFSLVSVLILVATACGGAATTASPTAQPANTAAPAIRRDLGGSFASLEWISAAYTLAMAVTLLLGSRLGDILGRRRVLLTGVGAFGAASALCALAPTADALIAARALQGAIAAIRTLRYGLPAYSGCAVAGLCVVILERRTDRYRRLTRLDPHHAQVGALAQIDRQQVLIARLEDADAWGAVGDSRARIASMRGGRGRWCAVSGRRVPRRQFRRCRRLSVREGGTVGGHVRHRVHRLAAVGQLLDLRHGVDAGRGRIARPVGEQHAVGVARQDVLGAGRGRHDRGAGADGRQRPGHGDRRRGL